jgi:steroid Delta-isomerase
MSSQENAVPTPEQIRDTVARYVERFNAGDREGWLDCFADGATMEDPIGSDVRVGRDSIAGMWDFAHSVADSTEMSPTGPVRVVTNEAAFPFHVVTEFGGNKMMLDVIDAMVFDDDGRIVSMRAYWNMAEMRPLD